MEIVDGRYAALVIPSSVMGVADSGYEFEVV
jgi:hypothetical protein